MITRLLARVRRGCQYRGPSGERIPARNLHPGQIVSRPEWAGGAPVRILTTVYAQTEVFVHYQDVACRQPKHSDTIDADTPVTLNPRTPTPVGGWWRRVERAATVVGLTFLTVLGLTTIATAVHNLITGPPHLLDVARVVACSGLLGLCIYLYRSTRRDA